jgi:hypothetical protein
VAGVEAPAAPAAPAVKAEAKEAKKPRAVKRRPRRKLPRRKRKRASKWDRKHIRMGSGWASSNRGAPATSPSATSRSCSRKDELIRKYLKTRAQSRGDRRRAHRAQAGKVTVTVHTGRPGVVIGKRGAEVDKLRDELAQLTGRKSASNVERSSVRSWTRSSSATAWRIS